MQLFPLSAAELARLLAGALTCCAGLVALPVLAQDATPAAPAKAQARWATAIAAFAAGDRSSQPQPGGVVFVGSSTVRLWNRMSEDFSPVPVINRGFGGSTMADCDVLARELVLQYRPRQVLVYAGDNDLAEGRTPADVLASFRSFVEQVRRELPDARIDYVSIKPSPARVRLLPQVRQANALIAGYLGALPNAGYIDVFTAMLDARGAPRADLYSPDRLHMNESGYALWRSLIVRHVDARAASVMPAVSGAR